MSYEVYERLCLQAGLKPHAVAREAGVSSATITNWKNGVYTPKEEKRKKLADQLGVSLYYLDTGLIEEAPTLDDEDRDLLQIIHDNPRLQSLLKIGRDLSEDDFNAVKDYAERLRRSYKE